MSHLLHLIQTTLDSAPTEAAAAATADSFNAKPDDNRASNYCK